MKTNLLPLGYEIGIGVTLLYTIIIQFFRNRILLIILLVDVATPLMVQTEDRPRRLYFPLSFVRRVLDLKVQQQSQLTAYERTKRRQTFSHFLVQSLKSLLDLFPPLRRGCLSGSLNLRHIPDARKPTKTQARSATSGHLPSYLNSPSWSSSSQAVFVRYSSEGFWDRYHADSDERHKSWWLCNLDPLDGNVVLNRASLVSFV